MKLDGIDAQERPPPLEEDDVAHIPKAKEARGALRNLSLEVCQISGSRCYIKEEHKKQWEVALEPYREEFAQLAKTHAEVFEGMFLQTTAANDEAEDPAPIEDKGGENPSSGGGQPFLCKRTRLLYTLGRRPSPPRAARPAPQARR